MLSYVEKEWNKKWRD